MKYTIRILALLLAVVCCASALISCQVAPADEPPVTTTPSEEAPSEYADLSPAEMYRALFEAEDFIAVAQLDISNAPNENMLRKILHKDEGRLLVRTEAYDGKAATRSTAYVDLDAALRYTQEEDEWTSQTGKGGKEALEEALGELLAISEKIPAQQLFVDDNYEKADENGCASLKESVLQTLFGENKCEVTYTQEAEANTYTLYATVLQKGERHTLTLTVKLVDATVELPEIKTEEEPEAPDTNEPVPPVNVPSEEIDPPTTDIPEVDPTDAKALIDRADALMGLLHSYTARSKTEMIMGMPGQDVVYTRLYELRADVVCKRVWEEARDSYISVENGHLYSSEGVIYYDSDVYMMRTDTIKQMAPMNGEALDGLITNLTATIATDLSIFRSVTVTEGTDEYFIRLTGLAEGSDPGDFLGGMLGNTGEMEIDYESFVMEVSILKDTGLYYGMSVSFDMTVTMDGADDVESNLEFFINYYDYNKTAIEKPFADGYTEVPLESLIG